MLIISRLLIQILFNSPVQGLPAAAMIFDLDVLHSRQLSVGYVGNSTASMTMVRISCIWQAAFAENRIDLVMTSWHRAGFMRRFSRLIIAISLALTIS